MAYFWLVECAAGGRTYRWSTEDLEVETAGGEALKFAAGLKPLELGQGDPEVDVEVLDPTVDWPSIGPLLDGARVRVRRWQQGTVIERAEVFAKGTATEPEWGSIYEPAEFTVLAVETLPEMPDLNGRVIYETTPLVVGDYEIPLGQVDRYYPVIFGLPGFIPGGLIPLGEGAEVMLAEGVIAVVPCPMRTHRPGAVSIYLSQIVISEDATLCLPSVVRVKDAAEMTAELGNVFAIADELGRNIGVADFTVQSNNVTHYDEEDEPVYLAGYGPGGIEAPRAAYDVIVTALQRWGGDTVDWARIPEIRDHLAGIQIDTWIDARVEGGVWGWLVDALGCAGPGSTEAAGLPLAVRTSAEGRYFVPLRYAVDPARTVRRIDVARGEASRVSSISVRGTPCNHLTLKYRDASHEQLPYFTTLTIGADTLNASSDARASVARFGRRDGELEVPWTWDPSTAIRMAHERLARDAVPWRTVQYRVPEEWDLREAQQVHLVDEEVGLDEHCIIDGPPFVSAEGVTITLRMPGSR